jgi:hypothetical protein
MDPAAVGLTCKEMMNIFAQVETTRLQKRVAQLELHIYHLTLPSLKECMKVFNGKRSKCFCDHCMFAGRADDRDADFDLWRATNYDHSRCCFKQAWEAFLREIGASYVLEKETADGNEVSYHNLTQGRRRTCLYSMGNTEWAFAGWGIPLTTIHSPRKDIWQKIIDECSTESDADEDDFASATDEVFYENDDDNNNNVDAEEETSVNAEDDDSSMPDEEEMDYAAGKDVGDDAEDAITREETMD